MIILVLQVLWLSQDTSHSLTPFPFFFVQIVFVFQQFTLYDRNSRITFLNAFTNPNVSNGIATVQDTLSTISWTVSTVSFHPGASFDTDRPLSFTPSPASLWDYLPLQTPLMRTGSYLYIWKSKAVTYRVHLLSCSSFSCLIPFPRNLCTEWKRSTGSV